MSPIHAVRTALGKYAVFSGRSRRAEFWWFALFCFVVTVITLAIDAVFFGTATTTTTATSANLQANAGPATLVANLALLLPGVGVSVRRLHDTNRRGWWVLLALVPVLGTIVVIILCALDPTPGHNRFGPNPTASSTSSQALA